MANTQKVMTLADTAKLIAKVHANAAKGVRFEYDGTKGEYGNIAAYFAAHKDGKVYGVRFPKYTYSNTPTGRPITKPKKPDTKVIASVSHTPRTSSHIIGSDITQYLYFYMVFLQPVDGCLCIFLCAVHFSQHDAEFHTAGVIHLRANNVVINVKATGRLRK